MHKPRFLTINGEQICFQIHERKNKHKANSFNVVIRDRKGHTLSLFGIQTTDPDEALEIAVARYRRSPFPKENLLKQIVEKHYSEWKDKEKEQEEAMKKIGTITFSATLQPEEEEETKQARKNKNKERLERAKKATELYEKEGATYKSVGDHFGVGPERIRQMVAFYRRTLIVTEPRPVQSDPEPPSGWEAIAARHGWTN